MKFSNSLNAVLSFAVVASFASAFASTDPHAHCAKEQPAINGVTYVSLTQLIPAQIRYSQANVQEKIEKALKNGDAVKDGNHYSGCHDHFKSIFPPAEAIPVIKAPKSLVPSHIGDSYVLIDGHHSAKASMQLGAQTIPIKIKADWSHKNAKDFWADAEKMGYAHLFTIDGQKVSPPQSFEQLADDSIRGFMAKVAVKCTYGQALPKFDPNQVLWVKVTKQGEKDIPFIEFKAADALKKGGFIYQNGQAVNPQLVFKARQILTNPAFKVEGLKVLVSAPLNIKTVGKLNAFLPSNPMLIVSDSRQALNTVCGVPELKK